MIVMGMLEYPRVSATVRGNPEVVENTPIHNMFAQAAARGLGIDVWFVTPWDTIVQGVESGDSPTPWVYRWQTIQPVTIGPGQHLDGSGGPLYMRLQNPSRDMSAMSPGLGEAFICLNSDGSSYQVGGVESNGNFLRGFARGATIWAVIVTAVVLTAGAITTTVPADVVVAGAVEPIATVATVAPVATVATVAPVATVATVAPVATAAPWTLAEVIGAVKTTGSVAAGVVTAARTVQSAANAVQSAASTVSADQIRAAAELALAAGKSADNVDKLLKDDNTMMLLACAAAAGLLLMG